VERHSAPQSGRIIWTGSQDASPAGWSSADFKRDLLSGAVFCGAVEEFHIRALRLGPASQLPYSESASGRLATFLVTFDDRSTLGQATIVKKNLLMPAATNFDGVLHNSLQLFPAQGFAKKS
jgi:hypothetical protein